MFCSHFDRSIQVLVKIFSVHLEGTFLRRQLLVKCRSHAILLSFVASVFLINLLALTFSKYLADIWNFNCSRISQRYLDADFKLQVSLPFCWEITQKHLTHSDAIIINFNPNQYGGGPLCPPIVFPQYLRNDLS